MFEASHIELNVQHLKHNIEFIQELVGSSKISSVVKGNAYGHGIEEYIPLAEASGISHFSVYSADEAARVHQIKKPETELMIMGSVDDEGLEWAIENGVEFWVFEFERLNAACEIAIRLGKPARVHIELETGMNRTGFHQKDVKQVISILKAHANNIAFTGLCTHFAGAESVGNYYRIKDQIKVYKRMVKSFEKHELVPLYKHACCSAAALRFPEMQLDLVRIGILQYGFWPNTETFIDFCRNQGSKRDPLKRILSWKSKIMSLKEVKTGDYVGYGTSYLAQVDTLLGVVPIGYSHGFSRSLSNQGRALVGGKRVGVIGLINMNCLMLDLSEVENPQKGDEVILIGDQGELSITVASFSENSDLLNYELLTRLPSKIPRRISD